MAANYDSIHSNAPSPYGEPHYNESSGFITPRSAKKRTSNWIKFGIPVLVLIIAGAVVGGVFGSRKSKGKNNSGAGSASGEAAASSAASVKLEVGRFATATNSEFMRPIYPSTVSNPPSHQFSRSRPRHLFCRQILLHLLLPRFFLPTMWLSPGQPTPSSQPTHL
jgi:hypothetical protein